MKRNAHDISRSDQVESRPPPATPVEFISFVVINIPRVNMLHIQVPSDYTVDGIKDCVCQALWQHENVTLRRSDFCLTQFNERVSYEAPASALNAQVFLSFKWTAREMDRPNWAYGL